MIKHINNSAEFYEEIKNFDCLVDFYTSWCGPCKMLSPIIEELDEKKAFGEIHVLKVDAEEVQDISKEFRIMAVPTLILFKGGKQVKYEAGYKNENELLDFIK